MHCGRILEASGTWALLWGVGALFIYAATQMRMVSPFNKYK
jgi:hypothetical protein